MEAPDFAVIGHIEDWRQATNTINAMRSEDNHPLAEADVRDILPWIPPRPLFRMTVRSRVPDLVVHGLYLETFIPPENLATGRLRRNLGKVRAAAQWADREGVRITSLGGFTSIILEGDTTLLPESLRSAFTTGNTLTTAYIAKGVERACLLHGKDLSESRMLIVGATGDIGSACVKYFESAVRGLLLCARNRRRLEHLSARLSAMDRDVTFSTELDQLLPDADVIILAASISANGLGLVERKPDAIVCDAGYPKNRAVGNTDLESSRLLFNGGLGQVTEGVRYTPDLSAPFYGDHIQNVAHGCALEAALLALENRFESYSAGRGNIEVEDVEEMWSLAQKHGFELAPFHNAYGPWSVKQLIS